MRPHYRWAAIAATLFATTLAFGQAAPAPGGNPLSRGESVFNGGLKGPNMSSPLNTNAGIGRPATRYGAAVTPVPEPSQWLMMLAGLGILGFIARRGSSRS
jgi:hypothetical protein